MERITEYAREQLIREIEWLLDDPVFLLHPDEDGAGWVRHRRLLAHDLGLDFDTMTTTLGSSSEQQRLREVLHRLSV